MAEEIYVVLEETMALDDNLGILESWTNTISASKDYMNALNDLWEVASRKYFLELKTTEDPDDIIWEPNVNLNRQFDRWYCRLRYEDSSYHHNQKYLNYYYKIQKCTCF